MCKNNTEVAALLHSIDASLVFVPLRLHGDQPVGPFDELIDPLLEPLPVAVLVLAAEDFDLDAEPEEGTAAETARLLDALSDAERLAELTAKDLRDTEAATQKIRTALKEAESEREIDQDQVKKLEQQLQQLESEEDKARRRAARTAKKAQAANREAVALGLLPASAENETDDKNH